MTKIYRKIWENNFGPIPKDEDGRTYEIHHIDGDKSNNNIENLKCVSIKDHYNIHYQQGDWIACLRMSHRMSLTIEEKNFLAKKGSSGKKWITNGLEDKLIYKDENIPDGWKNGRSKGLNYGERSEEFKQKMRELKKGIPLSEKHRKSLVGLKRGMIGKTHSIETKLKQSMASKGKPKSEEHKANLRKPKKKRNEDVCN